MNTTRDEAYEEIGATFQCMLIDLLNKTLLTHGVKDVEVRRAICEEYLFTVSSFLDQGWFEVEGTRFHPLLCFSMRHLDHVPSPEQLGTVNLPSEFFSYHEYAFGNVAEYFEENNESVPDLRIGVVDDDE